MPIHLFYDYRKIANPEKFCGLIRIFEGQYLQVRKTHPPHLKCKPKLYTAINIRQTVAHNKTVMGSPYKVVSSKGLIDSFRPIIATCLYSEDTGDQAKLDPSQMTIIRPTSN